MLIVTGTIAYDYIMNFPGKFEEHILPEHLHNINVSFIVDRFEKRRGGTAGNVSYTLGLLQTPHILFSSAGKDFLEYKKAFSKLGISLRHVSVDKKQYTATGIAVTDKANNQIWGFYYGAAEKSKFLTLSKVAKKKDLVLIGPQGADATMEFVAQCVKENIPYCFDPGFILTQVSKEQLSFGLRHAAYIIGNEYEVSFMRRRISQFHALTKDTIVVTTLGEKGAKIQTPTITFAIEPVTPKRISTTAGAGDAWRAGFLCGLARSFSFDIAGQMGAVAASFAIEHFGTQEHVFTKAQFTNRYRQTYGSLLEL